MMTEIGEGRKNMTNGEYYYSLTEDERKKFLKTYNNHPLAKYIDWKNFYESNDRNEMHFVESLRVDKDDNNNDVYVLNQFVKDGEDYELIYVDGEFQNVPAKG